MNAATLLFPLLPMPRISAAAKARPSAARRAENQPGARRQSLRFRDCVRPVISRTRPGQNESPSLFPRDSPADRSPGEAPAAPGNQPPRLDVPRGTLVCTAYPRSARCGFFPRSAREFRSAVPVQASPEFPSAQLSARPPSPQHPIHPGHSKDQSPQSPGLARGESRLQTTSPFPLPSAQRLSWNSARLTARASSRDASQPPANVVAAPHLRLLGNQQPEERASNISKTNDGKIVERNVSLFDLP